MNIIVEELILHTNHPIPAVCQFSRQWENILQSCCMMCADLSLTVDTVSVQSECAALQPPVPIAMFQNMTYINVRGMLPVISCRPSSVRVSLLHPCGCSHLLCTCRAKSNKLQSRALVHLPIYSFIVLRRLIASH